MSLYWAVPKVFIMLVPALEQRNGKAKSLQLVRQAQERQVQLRPQQGSTVSKAEAVLHDVARRHRDDVIASSAAQTRPSTEPISVQSWLTYTISTTTTRGRTTVSCSGGVTESVHQTGSHWARTGSQADRSSPTSTKPGLRWSACLNGTPVRTPARAILVEANHLQVQTSWRSHDFDWSGLRSAQQPASTCLSSTIPTSFTATNLPSSITTSDVPIAGGSGACSTILLSIRDQYDKTIFSDWSSHKLQSKVVVFRPAYLMITIRPIRAHCTAGLLLAGLDWDQTSKSVVSST